MDENKLLTAMEHIATGAENAAATAPSGSPHAMGWFARAKALLAELRADILPPTPPLPPADPVVAEPDAPALPGPVGLDTAAGMTEIPPQPADPADTSADAMNAGEAAALDQQSAEQHPA